MQRTLHSHIQGHQSGPLSADGFAALQRAQPHLVTLILAQASEYGNSAVDLSLWITHLIWRVAEAESEAALDTLESCRIAARFEQTTQLLYNLQDTDERFIDRALDPAQLPCPELARFIEELLLTFSDDHGRELSDGALGTLFALARTAIGLLIEDPASRCNARGRTA